MIYKSYLSTNSTQVFFLKELDGQVFKSLSENFHCKLEMDCSLQVGNEFLTSRKGIQESQEQEMKWFGVALHQTVKEKRQM